MTFYLQYWQGGYAASSKNRNFQSNTQQYAIVGQAIEVLHNYRYQNTQNQISQNQL